MTSVNAPALYEIISADSRSLMRPDDRTACAFKTLMAVAVRVSAKTGDSHSKLPHISV